MEDLRTIIRNLGKRFRELKTVEGFTQSDEVKQFNEFMKSNFKGFNYKVSAGQGRFATIPWVAIFDPKLSKGAQEGVYVDYLYSFERKYVFLCIQLGAAQFKSISEDNINKIKKNVVSILGKNVPFNNEIKLIEERKKATNSNLEAAKKYEDVILYSIKYDLDDLPSNKEMMNDLNYFVSLLEKITKEKLDEIFRNNSNTISEENGSYNTKVENPSIDKNTIFYGVPGTGKSYRVKQLIKENNISDEDVFRATLHPEFSYSDFIGQILPDVDDEDKPTYKYQPGIFTKALERALKVNDPVLLILEEMSRANVAAIFGDIFQLLDRDQSGKSDYGIDNDLIYSHLDKVAQTNLGSEKIKIPENLYIIGTVNTSDQNVFPMDNAFKRRFSWQYVSIDKPANDNDPQLIIRFMSKNKQIKEQQVSWSNLFSKLNDFIVSRDKGLGLTEDKQLGPYFIKFNDTNDVKTNDKLIKNKLLQYLWDDVQNSMAAFRNANITLFDKSIHSFSELYECYDKQQIFSNEFLGKDYLDLLNQEADNHEE